MNGTVRWWQQESPTFLNDTLAFINSSRLRHEAIGRCDDLCKALNRTWNAYFLYRSQVGQLNEIEQETDKRGGPSDSQKSREFMLHGLNDEQSSELCGSESLRRFAELAPQIMNQNTLLRRQYDGSNITDDLRKEASEEHGQVRRAFQRFTKKPKDQSLREVLLKKTASLLYVVRSNIAHSEKTPRGPDLFKYERDQIVSDAAAGVIDNVFEIVFDRPSQRLAVYGTLTPDGPNASKLADLEGQWHEGTVHGAVGERDGFQEFTWLTTTEVVRVKVLSASRLTERFDELDRFEGPRYQRILIPALIDGKLSVCNIYESNRQ
jgi:gamma-glutamylcyclotransferase (GGCT)/AIG2-like uncharacterized protein YtfP